MVILQIYKRLAVIFHEAANDDDIHALVLTGTGDFFSSGNDFIRNLTSPSDNALVTVDALELMLRL